MIDNGETSDAIAAPSADLPADLRAVSRTASDARAHPIEPGLWSLQLPLPYLSPPSVNAYLLEVEGGYALVDCGTSLSPAWEALEHALAEAGAAPEQLRLLICTHLHADHAGLAATVAARTGCDVLRGLGPDTVDDCLRDPVTPLDRRRALGLRAGIPAGEVDRWVDTHLADDVWHDRVQPTRLLVRRCLPSRIGAVRVIPARGHSPTQIALFEEGRRWLICADLAYPIDHPFLEYGWTLDPYAEHLASLDRALGLEPSLLLAGHGRPAEDARERLQDARQRAVELATRVRATLSGGARSAYEVVQTLLGDDPGSNLGQSVMSISLCVLEHLEREGAAVAEQGDDGVRRHRAVS